MDQHRRDFVKGAGAAVAAAMTAQVAPAGAQPKPSYEIYAAKYAGPFMSKLAFLLWNQGWDQDIERYYYIWVVKGSTETILVDTGVGVTMAADRKLTGYVNPVDVAARIGVKPTDVTKVIISHMHWDHVGGMEMFPMLGPGHTIGTQSLAVSTAKGTAVVASDCAHLARNIKEDTPSILITDLIGWMQTYDKVRAKASSVDLCFPGHDAGMLLNYPKVAEDVTRLA